MHPQQMIIERNEERNVRDENRDNKINRKELRTKISSRQDFVLLFGFEREVTSRILSPTQALYFMALHHSGVRRNKKAAKTT